MSQWFSITIGVCAERSEFSLAISRLQKSMKVVGQALAALVGLEDARMAMAKIITPHRGQQMNGCVPCVRPQRSFMA